MRHETPARFGTIHRIKLEHDHCRAVVDPILSPGIAADNIEVPLYLKLFALIRR